MRMNVIKASEIKLALRRWFREKINALRRARKKKKPKDLSLPLLRNEKRKRLMN